MNDIRKDLEQDAQVITEKIPVAKTKAREVAGSLKALMGRQWNARIWTVLATCKKQGRSSWQFLQNALSAHYFQAPAPSLIPQAN